MIKPLNEVNDKVLPQGIPACYAQITHVDGVCWVECMCADTFTEYRNHPDVASIEVINVL